VPDVYQAVARARDAGFNNISLDFMFGLPHQRAQDWENTLEQALALEPQHLSLYSLIIEENTPLHHWVQIGRVDAPDDDMAAELYEMAMARMAAAGYTHYEVSNWARQLPADAKQADEGALPALASQHNLVYWRNGEYLGIGPGAHSHLRLLDETGAPQSQRWGNRKPVPSYVNRILQGRPLHEFQESLPAAVAMGETMMLGLRLIRHGVPFAHFRHLHNRDLRVMYEAEIAQLAAQGLVEITQQRIRLTDRGLLLGNQVFERFIA
jgi:oxygen-independent coproporphyrinogen-3 oxidase